MPDDYRALCANRFKTVNDPLKYLLVSRSHVLTGITSEVLLIIGGSLLLASFEEYGWDLFLNGEKRRFFSHFLPYSFEVLTNPIGRALATAILSLPQITHYIIDGVIWKNNKKNPHLKPILEIGVNQ